MSVSESQVNSVVLLPLLKVSSCTTQDSILSIVFLLGSHKILRSTGRNITECNSLLAQMSRERKAHGNTNSDAEGCPSIKGLQVLSALHLRAQLCPGTPPLLLPPGLGVESNGVLDGRPNPASARAQVPSPHLHCSRSLGGMGSRQSSLEAIFLFQSLARNFLPNFSDMSFSHSILIRRTDWRAFGDLTKPN